MPTFACFTDLVPSDYEVFNSKVIWVLKNPSNNQPNNYYSKILKGVPLAWNETFKLFWFIRVAYCIFSRWHHLHFVVHGFCWLIYSLIGSPLWRFSGELSIFRLSRHSSSSFGKWPICCLAELLYTIIVPRHLK